MEHLSVGLSSVSQSIPVRRLLLRQLRATSHKGQRSSLTSTSLPLGLPPINKMSLCVCRSVVQTRGAVLRPEPGPTRHREENPLPVCPQQPCRLAGMERRRHSVRRHLQCQTGVSQISTLSQTLKTNSPVN